MSTLAFMSAERTPGRADAGTAAPADAGVLSDQEREVLAFEQRRWKFPGAKEAAIRSQFNMSAARYFQVLNVLIDKPAAAAAEPVLVARLRRLRTRRQQRRQRWHDSVPD